MQVNMQVIVMLQLQKSWNISSRVQHEVNPT